jgi:UDP-2,3-diacylglucosamine pyrophosphatase LpxH
MTVPSPRSVHALDVVSASSPSESLLVFSDVHLGSDIQDLAHGGANTARRSVSVDRDLVCLLAHYRAQKPPADRWRIVIAGDFIDFIGMTIAPDTRAELETALTDEERKHGVGNAVDHARLKLARVATRHADVFAALSAFVADGHALSIIHGNHDIEFHWDAVKDDFRAMLLSHAAHPAHAAHAAHAGPAIDADAFASRIEFNPWFFYRDGVAYIEHGHQYDAFCATEHIMAPLSPLDPRRVARGFCDTLLRFVVRPTRGMTEHGHENVGLGYYLRFGAQLGIAGMVRLGIAFTKAVAEMFRLRRAHLSDAAKALRAEHEERVARLAAVTRLGLGRLRSLLSLQARPITSTVAGIMRGVLLDRLAVAVLALLTLAVLAASGVVLGRFHGGAAWAAGGVVLAWTLLHVYFSRQRTIDPGEHMVDRAAHLAKLFPAAFVVMGHTHVPAAVPAGAATYINVGSWAEEADEGDPADGAAQAKPHAYRAARTHLVIHVRNERAEAEFCTWEDTGPQPRVIPDAAV